MRCGIVRGPISHRSAPFYIGIGLRKAKDGRSGAAQCPKIPQSVSARTAELS